MMLCPHGAERSGGFPNTGDENGLLPLQRRGRGKHSDCTGPNGPSADGFVRGCDHALEQAGRLSRLLCDFESASVVMYLTPFLLLTSTQTAGACSAT